MNKEDWMYTLVLHLVLIIAYISFYRTLCIATEPQPAGNYDQRQRQPLYRDRLSPGQLSNTQQFGQAVSDTGLDNVPHNGTGCNTAQCGSWCV